MIVNILRNVNLFVDGRGYAGQLAEVELPKLTVKTEEYRGGGMDGATDIDMGLEKLTATLTSNAVDAELLKAWGVGVGEYLPAVVRGALESDDGTVTAVVATMRGRVVECDFGTWKPGEMAPLKAMMTLAYYKYEQGGETIHEIDVDNMVRIVNGTDRLTEQRAALGI